MNHQATDVIIYTKNPLSDDQFSEVARQVKTIDGVLRFERSQQKPNFIMVAYRAGQTRAIIILNKLTRLGFNASLVGI
ncbi:MAG: hypothetical protein OEZ15_08035 [Gammaproteobacteria bacterium]|nr:hypothetical protein [Gammaproteobacteria bacterium]